MAHEKKKRKMKLTEKKCHLPLLKALSHLNGVERAEVVTNLTDTCLNDVCKVVYNILYNEFKTPAQQKKKMRAAIENDLSDYKYIAKKRNPCKGRRRRLVKQSGGSLGFILSKSIPMLMQQIYPPIKKAPTSSE